MPPTVESTQLWVPKWEKARSPTPMTKIIPGRVLRCFLYPVITAQMPKMAAESRNRFSTDFDAIKEAPREVSRLTATPESTQWIAHNELAIEPARSTSNASFIPRLYPYGVHRNILGETLWRAREDSNLRPSIPQTDALSTELRALTIQGYLE